MGNDFDGISFKITDIIFAIEISKVKEMVGGAEWVFSAGDKGIKNSIQVRGQVIPVVDLRRLFGFPSLECVGLSSFITVPLPGGNPSLQVALWVDTLLDLVHVSYGSIKNPPAALGMIPLHFIETTLEKSGVEIYVIHIEKILQEEFSNILRLDQAAS